MGAEGWLRGQEQYLLFQRPGLVSRIPIWWLLTTYNSSLGDWYPLLVNASTPDHVQIHSIYPWINNRINVCVCSCACVCAHVYACVCACVHVFLLVFRWTPNSLSQGPSTPAPYLMFWPSPMLHVFPSHWPMQLPQRGLLFHRFYSLTLHVIFPLVFH